jgi:hypothetical protein
LSVGEALGADIGGLSFSDRTAIGSATIQATGAGAGIATRRCQSYGCTVGFVVIVECGVLMDGSDWLTMPQEAYVDIGSVSLLAKSRFEINLFGRFLVRKHVSGLTACQKVKKLIDY